MRCKSCDRIMEDFEISKLDKLSGVPVELCSACLYVSNRALLGLDEEEYSDSYIVESDIDKVDIYDHLTKD